MLKRKFILLVTVLFLTSFAVLPALAGPVSPSNDGLGHNRHDKHHYWRISAPGQYYGYSNQIYPEVVLTSRYVEVRDGTKLAIDIYRPAHKNGSPVHKRFPVVWELTPYGRRAVSDWYLEFVKYGYVVARVDTRGRGASYGPYMGMHRRWEAWDGYDITEWLAEQPWCDGNVGMMGCSYTGIVQVIIASTRPPHLKAIMAGCHDFHKYGSFYNGGIYQDVRWSGWAAGQEEAGRNFDVPPVDEDTVILPCPADSYTLRPKMVCEAVTQHTGPGSVNEVESLASIPFSNLYSDMTKSFFWQESSPATYLSELNRSGIGVYLYGGWFDPFSQDILLEFKNLINSKVIMTPTPHCVMGGAGLDFSELEEHLRWFDYWLKGINNGIMNEPRVAYYPAGATDGKFRFKDNWPPKNAIPTKFYLNGCCSGTVNSVNDGILGPGPGGGMDSYPVDFTCTSGLGYTWDLSDRPDQTFILDQKGLTYTTSPLASDLEVTGQLSIHLWVSSTHTDGDFLAFLEEVDAQGSHYVSYGSLRASNRAVSTPWFDNFGLPWHPSFVELQEDLTPSEQVELVFDLYAQSKIFKAGNRIRLTITGADLSQVAEAPKPFPAPVVSVYHTSYITLPVIP